MKVLFPSSDWASNMGNAFFTEGVKYLLSACGQEILPTANHSTHALSRAPRVIKKNLFNYPSEITNLDAIMLAGPMLNENFEKFYGQVLRDYKSTGKKIFLVSAGGIDYSQREINSVSKLLKDIEPDLLWTRDNHTFELYGGFAKRSIKGICAAYFCRDYYPGYDTEKLKNGIILTFDSRPEPSQKTLRDLVNENQIQSNLLRTERNLVRRVFSVGRKSFLEGRKIIRPTHRPASNPWTFALQRNTFVSFTPWGYLNLYRNAGHVITDRLHAAVATISYGKKVNLFLDSPRCKLLETIEINMNAQGFIEYDIELLAQKKNKLQLELKDFFLKQDD